MKINLSELKKLTPSANISFYTNKANFLFVVNKKLNNVVIVPPLDMDNVHKLGDD